MTLSLCNPFDLKMLHSLEYDWSFYCGSWGLLGSQEWFRNAIPGKTSLTTKARLCAVGRLCIQNAWLWVDHYSFFLNVVVTHRISLLRTIGPVPLNLKSSINTLEGIHARCHPSTYPTNKIGIHVVQPGRRTDDSGG